ncbi:MAG: 30S ribosomal protein S13 [Candidatus Aenigmarchaeota archaeon]|nr:30S ribosomal protein S13 [Candidatus Aenigmarchaeota archaeon]
MKAAEPEIKEAGTKETARRIVRFLDTDIDGSLQTARAIRKIKGIGFVFSRISCQRAGVPESKKLGELGAAELKSLQDVIIAHDFPPFLLNRQKDMDTGKDIHLTRVPLEFTQKEDINLMKRIRSYKGVRHEMGQPVRGQSTRSTFRTQKTVGVSKKAVKEAKAPKAAPKPAPAKK